MLIHHVAVSSPDTFTVAISASRNEENELLRQQMGPEAVMSLLQGSGIDAEAALLRLGRPEGRVGGNGPAGSLEDVKRVWRVPSSHYAVLYAV